MPVRVTLQFTTIRAPRGKLTHAASLRDPGRTLCGRDHSGWILTAEPLDCEDCKLAALRRGRR